MQAINMEILFDLQNKNGNIQKIIGFPALDGDLISQSQYSVKKGIIKRLINSENNIQNVKLSGYGLVLYDKISQEGET